MIKKYALILLVLSLSFGCSSIKGKRAIASSDDTTGNPGISDAHSGLACLMSYSQQGVNTVGRMTEQAWMVPGSELKGPAAAKEFETSGHAHKIKIGQEANKDWSVRVIDSKGKQIGIMVFPEKGSMGSRFNVEAWYPESEDPPKLDLLDVNCHFTIFAG